MEELKTIEAYQEAVKSGDAILMFSADWCPDCRFIEPFLPELENEYPDYRFYYVDRDEMIDLCADLGIFGIPSFVAYRDGEEAGRFVNKDRKTKEQVQEFIESLT
ncbi:thioredoxin family protein [Bacillus marinisedimentorum]|uniref:thioredoxin family protein n=1 Tax=Bacillus marinisedimentorum TaxID=1821260 RepID=UPI000872D12D|nr:thioredoxin family protein [Bacillus marinisedimentorum]